MENKEIKNSIPEELNNDLLKEVSGGAHIDRILEPILNNLDQDDWEYLKEQYPDKINDILEKYK